MTPIHEWKLKRHQKKFGTLSIDECLELAIQAEEYAIPGDPTYIKFAQDRAELLEYALLLEKAN